MDELIAGKALHLTQFGRSMHELWINLIFAKIPQAKGHIERFGAQLGMNQSIQAKGSFQM